jgi:hypothetical protein
MSDPADHPHTPDGRYFVVRGRLWRLSNPALEMASREHWVSELMRARRSVRSAGGHEGELAKARRAVNRAKIALGERGPVWWNDGAPDYNRTMVMNSPYAMWFSALSR